MWAQFTSPSIKQKCLPFVTNVKRVSDNEPLKDMEKQISVSTEHLRHKRSLLQWFIKALFMSCESNACRGQKGDFHCQPCCVAKFRQPPSLHPASPPLTGELGYSWASGKSSVLVIREEQAGKLHLCQALLKNLSLSQASWMWLLFHYIYGSRANRFRVQGTKWFTTAWMKPK